MGDGDQRGDAPKELGLAGSLRRREVAAARPRHLEHGHARDERNRFNLHETIVEVETIEEVETIRFDVIRSHRMSLSLRNAE